jgi:hypothetical protein
MKFVNFGLSFLNKNIQLSTIFQLYREILLKVALDTIKQTNKQTFSTIFRLEFGKVVYLLFFI